MPGRRRRRQRRVSRWLAAAMAVVLASSVAVTVLLEQRAQASSEAALRITHLEVHALELGRALDEVLFHPSSVTLHELADEQKIFAAQTTDGMPGLTQRDRRQITAALAAYRRSVAEVAAAAAAGDMTAAHALDVRVEDPAYTALHGVLGPLVDAQIRHANAERAGAAAGSLGVLVGGVLIMSGLGLAAGRSRSREDRVLAEREAVARSEARFRALVEQGGDLVVVVDRSGVITSASPSAARLLGRPAEQLVGAEAIELIHPDDAATLAGLLHPDAPPGLVGQAELRARHADGAWRTFDTAVSNLLAAPEVDGWVLNARDATERRALADELRHAAFHDRLTGLANRALLADRLAHALARRGGPAAALLVGDLDGFKQVNDTLGHPAGDQLLAVVADRLLGCVRPEDTVARLGGDEFAVLIDRLDDEQQGERLAARLVDSVGQPVVVGGEPAVVGMSVGVAVASPGMTTETLLRQADVALYAAKRAGGRRVHRFDVEHDAVLVDRLGLERELSGALDRAELRVHYQPVIDLESGVVVGAEALVRWQRPGHGLVAPDVFIPVAEQTGLIVPIGRWVLEQACRTLQGWRERQPAADALRMAVNLSARQLHDRRLVDDVRTALAEARLPPDRLVLEITESLLVTDVEETTERLHALKALGVQLAVDDFGTGYSSLSYLRRFPVDTVKIDKSFLAGIDTNPQAATVLSAVLALGENLKLETLAEGVESADQARQLRDLHCHLAQGFHFARPLAAAEVEKLLATNRSEVPA